MPTIEAAETVYDEIARKGPQLDKKATLRENLLRNAKRGQASLGGIEKPDLRYLTYREVPKPRNRAVIFLAMDVSGSMDADRKRMARLFFYWCVQFLRSRYDQTEIVFVPTRPKRARSTEEEFFSRVESGGTKVSSAFEVIERDPAPSLSRRRLEHLRAARLRRRQLLRRQPAHARADPAAGADLLARRLPRGRPGEPARGRTSCRCSTRRRRRTSTGSCTPRAADDRELWPALKLFFAKDDVEAAVR